MSKEIFDLVYARVGARPLCLDLYLPEPQQRPTPLVVWIHGGAWRQGDRRTHCVATCLLPHGYAVASVSYRPSQEAIFPAQIHDCKAAVRWLRAHAEEYGLDPTALGAWGPSAGGHLVSLLGTTQGVPELEGELGNLEHSSAVQAVCDWFGPTDFRRMNDYPGDQDHDAPDSPESQLIGGPIQEHPDLVARANPVTYVSGNEPPFLIMHGDQDPIVPYPQSILLYEALKAARVPCELYTLKGAGHGGPAFETPENLERVRCFFDAHLRHLSA